MLRAAVDAGEVSLPLSSAHYMETHTRREWESRRDLATTMLALSRLHTIAPPDGVVPAEVDRALRERYGRPATVRPLRPFGVVGASHAFAREIPQYRVPDDLADMVADRWNFERRATELQETILLTGRPPEFEARMPDFKPLAHLKVGERYARDKEALRQLRRAERWHKGERADRVAIAQALTDHWEVINDAFQRAGISADALARMMRTPPAFDPPSAICVDERGEQVAYYGNDLVENASSARSTSVSGGLELPAFKGVAS
ncbi:MAG: hypothetical protein ACXVHQ_21915 [Solirubrobacteraceae bacterium]